MIDTHVQILACPVDEVPNAPQTVLWHGRRFAAAYGLHAPDQIDYIARGKPCFENPDIFFSVSHSGDYWVCAVSNAEVGIDLQKHQPCRMDLIAKRFFHPQEAVWIHDRGAEEFFRIWTAKESYVKFTGEGITDDFPTFSVAENGKDLCNCRNTFLQHIPFRADYSLCVCTAKKAIVTLKWYTVNGSEND